MLISTKHQMLSMIVCYVLVMYYDTSDQLKSFVKGVICRGPHIEFVERSVLMVQMEEILYEPSKLDIG